MRIVQKTLLGDWLRKANKEALIVKPRKSKAYRLKNPGQSDPKLTATTDYNLYPYIKVHLSRVLAKHELNSKDIVDRLKVGEKQVRKWLEQAKSDGFVYYMPKTKKYGLSSEQRKLE